MIFAVPHLPEHIPPVNHNWQLLFTLMQVPPLIFVLSRAVKWSREQGTLIPIMFILGGIFAMFNEPIVDHNGLVFFPTVGQWTLYTTFGIAQPVWLALAYAWFFGGQPLVVWRMLERGMRGAVLWKVLGVIFVVDVLLEHPSLYANLFLYYGHQPFQFTRFPLWWGIVNSTTPIVAATVIYALRHQLVRWRVLLVAAIVPMVQAGTNAATAWPTWNLLNTDLPAWVVWLGGVATFALCGLAVYLCTLAVDVIAARRTPELQPSVASTG